MANGSAPSAENSQGKMQFKFLAHVQSLPVVHDSIDQIYSHPLGRNAGDAIKVASQSAFKLSGPITPFLAKADSYAEQGLSNIENRFPIVKASTSEIKDKTSGAASATVGTYVGAVQDKWHGATSNGHAASEKIKQQTDGVVSSVHERIDPLLKPVVDTVENILDTYLPKAKAAAKDAKSSAKGAAKDAESSAKGAAKDAKSAGKDIANDDSVQDAKKEAEHQAQRIIDLSMSMFDRSKEKARSSISYAHESAAYAKDTALWSLNNPREVPHAAINAAKERTQYVVETVDGTVRTTRKRASSVSELAFQARDKAVQVFQEEQKAAPKDFPRSLVVSSINTFLRLSKESLDQAKTYFQTESGDVEAKADELLSKGEDKADELTSKAESKKDEVKGKASDATDKAEKKANEVSDVAQKKAGEVQSTPAVKKARKGIEKTADAVANVAK